MLRLRLPGGRLPAAALGAISAASTRYADGDVHLTSRANLQLRGVATTAGGSVDSRLVEEVVAAGFLPQPTHERVRNIVCSPLTGLSGGLSDLRPLTRLLDEMLCAKADLADLPGPFLFVLDDGRGDVAGLKADLGVCAVGAAGVRLRVGSLLLEPVMTPDAAAGVLIELAGRFLPFTRGSRPVWHVRELPQGGRELFPQSWQVAPSQMETRQSAPFGPLTQHDGTIVLSALVPLGVLNTDQVRVLVAAAGFGNGELIVTPWRGVLVPALPQVQLGELTGPFLDAGLELDDDPAWRGITACTGAPRCAHGEGPTRPLAMAIHELVRSRAGSLAVPVHVVGCARRCGSPTTQHIEVLTTGTRVEVRRDGVVAPLAASDVPAAVVGSVR